MTFPDSFYAEYVYDEMNRMTDIKLNGSGTPALEFDYDNLSRRTALTYENGVVTDYSYELDDDMDALEHTFDSSSVAFSYGFNAAHEPTSQGVDDSGFLWHPTTGSTVSYGTANALNQYPSVGGSNYSYDDNGNLTDDGTFEYTYDTENQLVEADDGVTVSSYIYDPMHRQAQKNVGGTKTRFIYSGWQRIADYDGSGNFVRRFIYGPGLDEALIELDASDDPTYLHHDRLGSIVAMTDDTGAVVNSYAYSPNGEAGSVSGTSIGFTGQRFDPETGLYYKNRYYSPSIGRFLQPDPIGYKDSLNLYTYAKNNPLRFTDPLGLEASDFQKWWDSLDSLTQALLILAALGGALASPAAAAILAAAGLCGCGVQNVNDAQRVSRQDDAREMQRRQENPTQADRQTTQGADGRNQTSGDSQGQGQGQGQTQSQRQTTQGPDGRNQTAAPR